MHRLGGAASPGNRNHSFGFRLGEFDWWAGPGNRRYDPVRHAFLCLGVDAYQGHAHCFQLEQSALEEGNVQVLFTDVDFQLGWVTIEDLGRLNPPGSCVGARPEYVQSAECLAIPDARCIPVLELGGVAQAPAAG